jgi:hypothetical protein
MTKTYLMQSLIEKVTLPDTKCVGAADTITLDAIPGPGLSVRPTDAVPTRVSAANHKNRFMGLNDLMNEIKQDQNYFTGDENVENKVLKQVLSLVEDKISEVKNQAVKWYVSREQLNGWN